MVHPKLFNTMNIAEGTDSHKFTGVVFHSTSGNETLFNENAFHKTRNLEFFEQGVSPAHDSAYCTKWEQQLQQFRDAESGIIPKNLDGYKIFVIE